MLVCRPQRQADVAPDRARLIADSAELRALLPELRGASRATRAELPFRRELAPDPISAGNGSWLSKVGHTPEATYEERVQLF